VGFELDARQVLLAPVVAAGGPATIAYDTLVVGGGSQYSYFGHDEWRAEAAEVKSLESAISVRNRLLAAFEAAELESNNARREPDSDLGGRCHRLEPCETARRADRCRGRPGWTRDGRARPHAAGPPRGLRARRHGPRAERDR